MVDYFFGTIFRDSGANAGRTYYAITHARMEGLGLLSASQQTLSECIPVLYGGLTLYTESTYALLDFFQDRGALALRNIKRLEVEVYLLQAEEVTTEYIFHEHLPSWDSLNVEQDEMFAWEEALTEIRGLRSFEMALSGVWWFEEGQEVEVTEEEKNFLDKRTAYLKEKMLKECDK
ncbi:hypothetical protein MMC12_003630 [Toensbergia leucococca]|nr:hypothetical protein [Toensbergia leucococca]